MFEPTHTRRAMLRRTLAATAAGALLGTAGCAGLNPLSGGGGAYADWLPVPDDIGDSDHYQFAAVDTETLAANEAELGDGFTISPLEESWNPADIDWEDTSTILFFRSVVVIRDGFTREDVVADLEDADYEADGEHQGHTMLVGPNELSVFAVGDATLALQTSAYRSDPVDTVAAVLDAKHGDGDRYGDDNEDMATLLGELGAATVVSGRTMAAVGNDNLDAGRFDDMVADGSTTTIDGETADRTWVVIYESADDVDLDDLADWVDENDGDGGTFDDVDDIGYSRNGRAGIVTGTSDTDDL